MENTQNSELNPLTESIPDTFEARKSAFEQINPWLASIPMYFRERYVESLLGEGGRAQAVKMKCYECVGFEDARNRIRECSVTRCPLRPFRPFKEDTQEDQ